MHTRSAKRLLLCALLLPFVAHAEWYRGNTHTHTINSDGDSTPDIVARWYREHDYQFVVITDHEYLTDIAPLNALYGAEGQFLVIRGQEVTQRLTDSTHPDGRRQAHINSINPRDLVLPLDPKSGIADGVSMLQSYRRNITAIRAAGGLAQVNHPNYRWSVQPKDLFELPDQTLLEIWNAGDHHLGGADDAGNTSLTPEALWDVLLSRGQVIWGVPSDDTHELRSLDDLHSARPGLGWIVVRASALTAESISAALRQGDFYSSTGVTLDDYIVKPYANGTSGSITITIPRSTEKSDDRRFLTRFIGKDGRVLAEVPGHNPQYAIRGDEGYVRATITDSAGHHAWTQPYFPHR